MKTVTSEGNLSGYFALPAEAQMDNLNYKVKQIKNALIVLMCLGNDLSHSVDKQCN